MDTEANEQNKRPRTGAASGSGGTSSAAAAGGYTPGTSSGSGGQTLAASGPGGGPMEVKEKPTIVEDGYDDDLPVRALERRWMKEVLMYDEWRAKGWVEPLL